MSAQTVVIFVVAIIAWITVSWFMSEKVGVDGNHG